MKTTRTLRAVSDYEAMGDGGKRANRNHRKVDKNSLRVKLRKGHYPGSLATYK